MHDSRGFTKQTLRLGKVFHNFGAVEERDRSVLKGKTRANVSGYERNVGRLAVVLAPEPADLQLPRVNLDAYVPTVRYE
jgi:hypothetical protein